MKSARLNSISNLYFSLIASIGIIYTTLLIIAFEKILPAFLMQIIFLLDAIKFNGNIWSLLASRSFLINVIPAPFLILFVLAYVVVFIRSLTCLKEMSAKIRQLRIVKIKNNYFEFKSSSPSIFTAGLISPKVYISSAIFTRHDTKEIAAMIRHEINHQKNHHPLKMFIANFVKSVIPRLPIKDGFINNYLVLLEVSSDKFSEEIVQNKLPLVSALLKFQEQNFEPSISYFNSQSERIKILVGQKKQHFKLPAAYFSLLLVTFFSTAILVKNSTFLYDCQHLVKCIEILMSPNSQPLSQELSSQDTTQFSSVHCQ